MKKGLYEENGISLSKSALKAGDEVTITYTGLLRNSGAQSVRVHIGYNEAWENSAYIEMKPSDAGFAATIGLTQDGLLNFAFTDPAGNWDNNSGKDYSIKVAAAKAPGTSKETSEATKPAARAPKVKKAEKTDQTAAPKANKDTAPKTGKETTPKAAKVTASKAPKKKSVKVKTVQTSAAQEAKAVAASADETKAKRGPGRPKKHI